MPALSPIPAGLVQPGSRPELTVTQEPTTPRTAFVLAGGASLGALQVGMLRALYERGVAPDLLVGTSVGALNAAFIATRPPSCRTASELARVWCEIRREDVFPASLSTLVRGFSGARNHLVPPHGLRRLAARHLEIEDLADAAIPLHLVAFDLRTGREVLLSAGPAHEALVAAASIPGVFPPVPLGDALLIDGGVTNNTPISHAVALGAERIYVLTSRHPERARIQPPASAVDAAMYALGLLVDSRLMADIALYREQAELIVLPAESSVQVQPADFDCSSQLIRDGYTAARRALDPLDVKGSRDVRSRSDVLARAA